MKFTEITIALPILIGLLFPMLAALVVVYMQIQTRITKLEEFRATSTDKHSELAIGQKEMVNAFNDLKNTIVTRLINCKEDKINKL